MSLPYHQILERLGPRAAGLNRSNLSRWKKTGYLVWLAEQQRREDVLAQVQLLFDIVQQKDNAKLHEAAQQIAALRISQILAASDTNALCQSLQQHPQAFVRLLQALPGLSRAGMDCERLLHEIGNAGPSHDPEQKKRIISNESQQYLIEKMRIM